MPANINMRYHLRGLINGDSHNIDYGHWVIYRELDHTQRSIFWDDMKKESIGGPKWFYRDYLIRTRRFDQRVSSGGDSELLTPEVEGLVEPDSILYYIEVQNVIYRQINSQTGLPEDIVRPLKVQIEDVIYEIDKFEGTARPDPPYQVLRALQVRDVVTIRGDHGRVEYDLAITKDWVKW